MKRNSLDRVSGKASLGGMRWSRDLTIVSYSHKDEVWKNLLVKHLAVLAKQGITEIWTDRQIRAGDPWKERILRAIDAARVVILLISADSLTSDFILNFEVPRMLERHQEEEIALVPVLVRPCAWEAVDWLREIQMRPWNGNPLSLLPSERSEAEVAEVAKEVLRILNPDLGAPFDKRLP